MLSKFRRLGTSLPCGGRRASGRAAAPRRPLTAAEVALYRKDGFLRATQMFSAPEMELLLATVEADAAIGANVMPMADAGGRVSKLTLWFSLGDDTYSAFARSASIVSAAEVLTGAEEPGDAYMFSSKVMLKEPGVGGAWEWHQDFGYWHEQGPLLQPDKCFSCIVALDDHRVDNGCLQVLAGSHRLGRLDHGVAAGQAGVAPRMLGAAAERCDLVHCELDAGDVLFTHSNLLHASAPNESARWRRSLIMAFTTRDNQPLPRADGAEAPSVIPLHPDTADPFSFGGGGGGGGGYCVLPDEDLLGFGVVPHAADRADFLSAAANLESFTGGDEDDTKT